MFSTMFSLGRLLMVIVVLCICAGQSLADSWKVTHRESSKSKKTQWVVTQSACCQNASDCKDGKCAVPQQAEAKVISQPSSQVIESTSVGSSCSSGQCSSSGTSRRLFGRRR